MDGTDCVHLHSSDYSLHPHFRGVKLLYLPPYSPNFNPIEECFSFMKNGIPFRMALESKNEEAIECFISDALSSVTPRHARGWFAHSNYI
ncbi:hypothetical protein K439DRAFT_1353552 [Ramaria rubella]|nr:hypothetical protein K439DRAFT_1353552 [Ramaria rubella]